MRSGYTPEQLFNHLDAVWRDACGGRAMPSRSDINPAKAGRALGYLALLDLVPGERRDFRYRLIGQHLVDRYGRNLTGGLHTEHFPCDDDSAFQVAMTRCVETREPQSTAADFRNHNQTPCRVEARVWPLSDDGQSVSGLLVSCVYVDRQVA